MYVLVWCSILSEIQYEIFRYVHKQFYDMKNYLITINKHYSTVPF